MPIVTIQVTREGTKPGASSVTAEEKAALIKGASQLFARCAQQAPRCHLRHHRGSRHEQLGLGGPARTRIPSAPGGSDSIGRPFTPDRGSRSRGLSRVGGIGVELVQVWHASPSFKVRWSAAFTWPQWSGRRAEASPTDPSNRIPKVALSRLHQGIASALLQTQRRPRGRDDCL